VNQSSSATSWKIKAGFIAFGLLVGILVSELALEILLKKSDGSEFENLSDLRKAMLSPDAKEGAGGVPLKNIINPHPDDKIIYDLRPNLEVKFQRAQVQTNSCGMRDLERSIQKPEGIYRIGLFGDSFAFGWGVQREESFASVLEDTLNALSNGTPRFEVLNFGVPGYSTFQEFRTYELKGAEFDLDEALIYFVDNDFGLPFFVHDVGQSGGLLSATRFAQLSWKAVNPDIEAQKAELMGLDPNRTLKKFAKRAARDGVRLNVTVNPSPSWKKTHKRLWVLERDLPVRHIKLRRAFLEYVDRNKIDPKTLSLSFDPHPSPLKHRILGELLAPYFLDVIGSWRNE
jgi:hypothetical protein